MRALLIAGWLLAACSVVPIPAAAVTFPDKPPQDHFYVDEAGLIGAAEGQEIDDIAGALLKEEQVPLIVVTIESLMSHDAAGYTIERYASELFNHWGIGSQRRNYGMLLLVSSGDRKARIELGAGWGHSSNLQAQKVMNDLIVPEFRRDNYSEGILAGVRGMDAMARGLQLPQPKPPWWVLPLFLAFLAAGDRRDRLAVQERPQGLGLGAADRSGRAALLPAARLGARGGGAFGGGSSGGGGATRIVVRGDAVKRASEFFSAAGTADRRAAVEEAERAARPGRSCRSWRRPRVATTAARTSSGSSSRSSRWSSSGVLAQGIRVTPEREWAVAYDLALGLPPFLLIVVVGFLAGRGRGDVCSRSAPAVHQHGARCRRRWSAAPRRLSNASASAVPRRERECSSTSRSTSAWCACSATTRSPRRLRRPNGRPSATSPSTGCATAARAEGLAERDPQERRAAEPPFPHSGRRSRRARQRPPPHRLALM